MPRRTNPALRSTLTDYDKKAADYFAAATTAAQPDIQALYDKRANIYAQMEMLKEGGFKTAEARAAWDKAEADLESFTDQIEMAERELKAGGGIESPWNADAYRKGHPIPKNGTYRAAARTLQLQSPGDDAFDSITQGDEPRARHLGAILRNALSSGGSVIVPTGVSADLIDLARNKTQVFKAGARLFPMANAIEVVPRWASDPTATWVAEGTQLTPSDPTIQPVTLTSRTLATLVQVQIQLLQDSAVDLTLELANAFAAAFAVTIDKAALYGVAAPSPIGLKNTAAVAKTPLGANGATPAWGNLVDSVGRLRDANENPGAQIMADRTKRSLSKILDTTQNYVAAPTYLDGIPRLDTNQVPVNLTVGTSSDTSDIFTGDFSQLFVGVRHELEIQVLKERYADYLQVGFLCFWRGDIQVARPAAFDIVTGVRP